jgi:hypothetical protein
MKYLLFLIAAGFAVAAPSAAQAQGYGDPASLVDYWYRTYLGRAPDPSGMATWVNALNQGQSADAVLSSILGNDEFYQRAGSTPEGFITLLFTDIVRQPPTPGDVDFWVRRLYTEDRHEVADELLTQHPGVWVGTGSVVAPPVPPVTPPAVVVAPGLERNRYQEWERDRRRDWDRHRDIHEYRRPEVHHHDREHHDRDHH